MFWMRNKENSFPIHNLIWSPELVSVTEQAGFAPYLVANPKDRFSCDKAHISPDNKSRLILLACAGGSGNLLSAYASKSLLLIE